jgi:glycosidase
MSDFRNLVKEAHAMDMKVLIDLFANHTSWDNVFMHRHPEFYNRNEAGQIIAPNADWHDVADLNYDNPELRREMIDMLKFWVGEVGVDGFRCDVAGEVPTDFWEQARRELEEVNPDVLMFAEASKPELLLEAFDFDYAWPMLGAFNEVFMHSAPASKLRETWEDSRERFPVGSIHLRMADNHDEARAVARFSIQGALAAQVINFTLDGVPLA